MFLHQSAVAAATQTDITGGGAAAGTYMLALCNRTSSDVTVRIAITNGAAPTDASWINYGRVIEGNGELARWPIALDEGWRVYVYASAAGISATLNGVRD